MSPDPDERPFSESNLDVPEYREKLLQKLQCLIAVLEVAGAKVKRALDVPDADVERLLRIQKNLGDTLEVCRRARRALEARERLPDDLPESLRRIVREQGRGLRARGGSPAPRGREVEIPSTEEAEKFRRLGPISLGEIARCDLDDLARRLQDD